VGYGLLLFVAALVTSAAFVECWCWVACGLRGVHAAVSCWSCTSRLANYASELCLSWSHRLLVILSLTQCV